MGDTIEERQEQVDEVSSGHELYRDEVSLTVTFERLTEPQAIALSRMFEQWGKHGRFGASRWVSFYVDGDGAFHPSIDVTAFDSLVTDGAIQDAAEIEANKFDADAVTGAFIDAALELEDDD